MVGQIITYVPALLIPGLVNFLALAIYTRLLSVEAFGRYSLILAIVVIVKMIGFEWLRLGLFRFFQKKHRDGSLLPLLSTIMAGFVITCSIVSLAWVTILILVPIQETLKADLWIALPLLLVWALFEQILQMNRAALAPARYGCLSASRAILSLAAALFFIVLLNQAEKGLIFGLIFSATVPIIIDLPRWIRGVSPYLIERSLIEDLLRYGMPFTVTLAMGLVISLSDRFLLQHFMGSEAVGVYTASYDLANQTVMMVFTILNLAVYPLVLRALELGGKNSVREQLRRYAVILLALTLPSSVGLAIIAKPLSNVLLGESFRYAAGQLIPWIALSTFLMGTKAFYFDLSFQLGLRTDLQIWPVLAAAIINIVLNCWWIPIYGLIGAVGASCAAYAVALTTSIKLGRKIFPMPFPVSDFFRILFTTLIMSMVLIATFPKNGNWITLGATFSLGVGLYTIMSLLTDVGEVRRHLLSILRWIFVNFMQKTR